MNAATDTDARTAALGGRLLWHVVLPLSLLTFVNAIDRVNVSFAAHAMGPDIGLSPTTFGLGVSAFFVAYLLFQYPHAALLRRFGIRRWLLVTVTLWGVAGLILSHVQTANQFLGARFLLGMAEAGFAPGVTWFINRWMPPAGRAKAMATVLAAVPLSMVLGGPLCGWLLGMEAPAGMVAWRWMFFVQALPNFVLAIAAYFYFRDSVDESPWLSADERALLQPASVDQPRESLLGALVDRRVLQCSATWLFIMTGAYALLYWLPQMVRQMGIGHSEFQIGTIAALPQLGLVIGMMVNGWHSDRTGERRWHVAIAAAFAGCAMLAGGLLPPGWPALALLTAAGFGIGASQSVFWAVPSSMGVGNGRISVAAVSLISMAGTAGGIIGPTLIGAVKDMTGSFLPSLVVLSLMLVAAGLVIAPFGKRENAQ